MKIRTTLTALLVLLGLYNSIAQSELTLAGTWQLRLDPTDEGIRRHWWSEPFPDTISLPGSLTEHGKGNEVTLQTPWTGDVVDSTYFFSKSYQSFREGDLKIPFWLKPVNYYAGPAWYRRQVDIPAGWKKQRVVLNLERCHWKTMVFVNGQFAGSQNSLVAAHQFDLTNLLQAGRKNTITIRVDNNTQVYIGQNSHSISDHTQTNWNGLVGNLSLRSGNLTALDEVQVYPNISQKNIRVTVGFSQPRNQTFSGKLLMQVRSLQNSRSTLPQQVKAIKLTAENTTLETTYSIPSPQLWDEFSPNRYELSLVVVGNRADTISRKKVTFGMREIGTKGTRITVNGRPVFLRGDVDCAAFPLTGYPPTDYKHWKKIMRTLKEHGLNHLRFHSWCPPEAAFQVADELGLYLYVESPSWANQGSAVGAGGLVDDFIYQESERMLKAYGNHPSFCMMSYGNEPAGVNQGNFLGKWVLHFKARDARRLYTSGAGWPMLPENQFHIHSDARIQRWGEGLASIINRDKPRTDYDWRTIIRPSKVPYISHEIGQWCVYPNFDEMAKYTGVLKPTNFEIFRQTLQDQGMGDQARDFLMASGRLQTLCYKADIEAALRTPGFGGFQLLGLHDFPGQGTALVGALDVFYEPKPYTSKSEYSQFCNATVLLARLDKLVFQTNESVKAAIEIAHFGAHELTNQTVSWSVTDDQSKVLVQGKLNKERVHIDNAQPVGLINVDLSSIKEPTRLTLTVQLVNSAVKNSWHLWVYPAGLRADAAVGNVLIAHSMTDEVVQRLEQGATVLLLPYGRIAPDKGAQVKIGFSTVFWNTSWTMGQPPHTLGLVCNPKHPALAHFPTESFSDYQWHDVVSHAQPMILNEFPKRFRPVIQPIDTWFENRRLALAFEGKVGKGKLLVCSVDLETDLSNRPPARQLKYSLLRYMNSDLFNPEQALDTPLIRQLLTSSASDRW
ncbi:glycoside hydrolase family 2 [Spirosoma sp. 209]|uniref:glycoside hydrolase family 2 n=1 Tax=Spirosoma sp. 209 TaxID=1955701 RepID=UPI00098D07AF|nr:glycoside hydrolase family 2 [Spirosoma sp. 209]